MKRVLLFSIYSVVLLYAAVAQTVPGLDTMTGKVDRYYYYSWYDACPEFSNGIIFRLLPSGETTPPFRYA